MLRLAPTLISLTPPEVKEYENRRQHRRQNHSNDSILATTLAFQELNIHVPPPSRCIKSRNVSIASSIRNPLAPSPAQSVTSGHRGNDADPLSFTPVSGWEPSNTDSSVTSRLRHRLPSQPSGLTAADLRSSPASRRQLSADLGSPFQLSTSLPMLPSFSTFRMVSQPESSDAVRPVTVNPLSSNATGSWLTKLMPKRLQAPVTHSRSASVVSNMRRPPSTPTRTSSLQPGHHNSASASVSDQSTRSRPRQVEDSPLFTRSVAATTPRPSRGHRRPGRSPTRLRAALELDGNLDFEIYNDERPAAEQPQTPQQLPDARHRGRLGGAYTAPVSRIGLARAAAATAAMAMTPGSARRRYPLHREASPPGLDTPGFRGLYGGLENTDDATLFETGTRLAREHSGRGVSADGGE